MKIEDWLEDGHPAFEEGPKIKHDHYFSEIGAMQASGLSDDEWYSLTRAERARRVAHGLCKDAISAMYRFDTRPEPSKK